jgi:hypothetical protein
MMTFTRIPYAQAARFQDSAIYAGLIAIAALLIGILLRFAG